MSSIFELDQGGWEKLVADGRLKGGATEADAHPSPLANAVGGTASGVGRGIVHLNDLFQTIGPDLSGPSEVYDADASQALNAKVDPNLAEQAREQTRKKALDFWTPDPHTTGFVGRVLGGLGEGLTPLIGGPEAMVGANTLAAGKHLVDEGADNTTAGAAAAVEGLANYAGLHLTILGKTLGQRVFTGMAGNVALGAGSALAEQKLLEGRGYDDLAQQYDPLDPEGRAVDLLMGAAFGGIHHLGARMPPSARDAVLAAANARHFQVDTAPGRPLDAAASKAHQDAMATALDQMDRGEPVSVDPAVTQANFEPRPAREPPDEATLREVFGEDIPREPAPAAAPAEPARFEFEPGKSLTPADTAIEQKFGQEIGHDVAGAERRYNELQDSRGGKVLNVDTARELSPDYLADRTKSAAVHEPASAFIKQLYAQKLAEPPKAGELPLVLFTAGGTGAGKTTAIKNALGGIADKAQIVYDTNMNGVDSSIKKIDQALAAGKNVMIAYTYRDPIMALREGALPRAMRQEKQFGSGRTVPIEEHLKTHIGSREAVDRIAAHYAGDDRVQIQTIDNSRGAKETRLVGLGKIPKFEPSAYNQLREQALAALNEERTGGRISEAVYHGSAPANRAADSLRGIQQDAGTGAGGEPQPQRADRGSKPVFEPTGSEAVKPGEPFLAARFGSSGALDNRNAGNAQSVADFLARTMDPDRPQAAGSNKSDTLTVYEVTTPASFGKYELGAKGKPMAGETVGRQATKDGVSYSFPAGAKYEAKPVLKIRIEDLLADLKQRTGTDNFDDLGSRAGGQALEAIIQERLAPTESVATAMGRKIEVRPRLVDIGQLVTSDKAEYPQELQPRQRGARKALDEQVQHIAKNLDPARLGDSAEADRGAPITGDGVVESGNGRVMALRYAYEHLPEKAAEYRKFLESQGYDLAGVKNPMLVRERVSPLSEAERRAFTVEANQAATAALSPVERAQSDARLLDSAALSRMRGGDIASVQNSDFVRGFLEQLPQAERNALVNPDGSVSQEGVRRIQAALLAKAYGGTPESNVTLGRMLESTDSDMRSALGGLLDASPAFARLRQAIADGKISGEYDIAPALTAALENVARLRLHGQSLRDFLAQGDMLTQRPPIVDELTKVFFDKTGTRMAGREKIAAALTKYAGQASKQRLDQSSLFAEAPVPAEKLVADTTAEEQQAPKISDMFGLRTPQSTGAVPAAKAALEGADVPVATGATDENGDPVTRSGREVMAEAEADIGKAESDAKGYAAAVGCLLTKGFDNAA